MWLQSCFFNYFWVKQKAMKLTEKQSEIIEISKKLFFFFFYVETSMRDIGAQMDVKASSLYAHFTSKEEILKFICEDVYERFIDVKNEVESSGLEIEERFKLFVKRYIEEIMHDVMRYELYYKYWGLVDISVDRKYSLSNFGYIKFTRSLLSELFPNEKPLPCYIPDSTTYFILETLRSIPRWVNPANPDIEMIVQDFQYRIIYGFHKDLKK